MKCATPDCCNAAQPTAPFCIGCQSVFPSFAVDEEAYRRARAELGGGAQIPLGILVARAQEIKMELRKAKKTKAK